MAAIERVLQPKGSCTWCGHKPHDAACPARSRVRPPAPPFEVSVEVDCRCARQAAA